MRKAADVLDELKTISGDYVFFLDDNLIGYGQESRGRAAELFKGMIQLGLSKKWWMQTSINAAEDEHLIQLAAEAG
ncbi:MAG: radical SAM protein, partial [Desulfobacterales bacterium]|nr:radical SAM protein [Desulfobacterales bacterium]